MKYKYIYIFINLGAYIYINNYIYKNVIFMDKI